MPDLNLSCLAPVNYIDTMVVTVMYPILATVSIVAGLVRGVARRPGGGGIFLFDKDGTPIGRFAAQDLPKIEQALENALAA